jgi:hypothetical protein
LAPSKHERGGTHVAIDPDRASAELARHGLGFMQILDPDRSGQAEFPCSRAARLHRQSCSKVSADCMNVSGNLQARRDPTFMWQPPFSVDQRGGALQELPLRIYEIADHILITTLKRAEWPQRSAGRCAVPLADEDDGVRAIIITGTDSELCSGRFTRDPHRPYLGSPVFSPLDAVSLYEAAIRIDRSMQRGNTFG